MENLYDTERPVRCVSDITIQAINLVYCEEGHLFAHWISKVCLESSIVDLLNLFKRTNTQHIYELSNILCNQTQHLPKGFKIKNRRKEDFDFYRSDDLITRFSVTRGEYVIGVEKLPSLKDIGEPLPGFENLLKKHFFTRGHAVRRLHRQITMNR